MKIEEKIENRIKMLELDIQIAKKELASNNSMINLHKEEIAWCEEHEEHNDEIPLHEGCLKDCEIEVIKLSERITVFGICLNSLKDLIK